MNIFSLDALEYARPKNRYMVRRSKCHMLCVLEQDSFESSKSVVFYVSLSFSLCLQCSEKFLTPVETLMFAL